MSHVSRKIIGLFSFLVAIGSQATSVPANFAQDPWVSGSYLSNVSTQLEGSTLKFTLKAYFQRIEGKKVVTFDAPSAGAVRVVTNLTNEYKDPTNAVPYQSGGSTVLVDLKRTLYPCQWKAFAAGKTITVKYMAALPLDQSDCYYKASTAAGRGLGVRRQCYLPTRLIVELNQDRVISVKQEINAQ